MREVCFCWDRKGKRAAVGEGGKLHMFIWKLGLYIEGSCWALLLMMMRYK